MNKKPLLTISEQIEHLKAKGITFSLMSEQAAADYLENHNNYFKLASYRKNFPKHPAGKKSGQYICLDFGQLVDLAIIDIELRYTLLHLALDVEHYADLDLLRNIAANGEDGYQIVEDYYNSLSQNQLSIMTGEINRNSTNAYCGGIVQKYSADMPVWAFLEIIPFGRMISFYKFCANRFGDKRMQNNFYLLLTCKDIRNACAHNSCILNDLSTGNAVTKTKAGVHKALSQISTLSKSTRSKKMSNERIQQIVTLLYTHKTLVTSPGVSQKASYKTAALRARILKNSSYYDKNAQIKTSFDFLITVIDNWF